ncbi:hypothetical protein [Ottowia sp.]|uniref:hypothetical protein n=1 Tax=Ottowia sp. TaxID=1898956 RepID=UPI00261FFFAF|nr:hypothetical protein [Ottowia sp.]
MSAIARWSLDELRARYELEPELDDLYVEGTLDREILAQAAKPAARLLAIYEVDCVELPSEVLSRHGLTSGNKQRVIALSRELSSLPASARVKCLADRDLDHWFGPLEEDTRLKWTAFCSIESHYLVSAHINDLLVTTGRAKIKRLESLVDSLHTVLKHLYALRLADRQLGLSLAWPSFRKYLSSAPDVVSFDSAKYTTALLTSCGKAKHRQDFERAYANWLGKFTCDVRLAARGHDLTELLAWALSEFSGHREFASPKAIERLFVLLARSVDTLRSELQ